MSIGYSSKKYWRQCEWFMANFDRNRFASAKEDWQTPQDEFDKLNAEFHFTLDVAASAENAKCACYFTKEQDALKQDWRGVCWMNPPYGIHLYKWIEKAYTESQKGATVVCYIPARTNTNWFHDYCLGKGEVRFVRGRPKFVGAKHGLPQPIAIVIFRPEHYFEIAQKKMVLP